MDRMYRSGGARFWPDQHMLSLHGIPHRLGARAVDLLKLLVESGGELLSRGHLVASIWPGVVVDENSLALQIANLRKVLGAEAITTVAGRGYGLSHSATLERAEAPSLAAHEAGTGRLVPAAQALPHALTRFIGFAAERAQCAQLLRSTRLLTLTGIGRTGKTRLAIEVARGTQATYADSACFIDLAPLVEPGGLARTVATALGLSEATALSAEDALLRHLRAQHCLLVFDNCEHLLPACATLVDGAHPCPQRLRQAGSAQQDRSGVRGAADRVAGLTQDA